MFALKFGNDFVAHEYRKELNSMYPNIYFYDIWLEIYTDFKCQIEVSKIEKIPNLLFEGTSFENVYHGRFKAGIKLEDVYHGSAETIYLVK